MDGRPTPPRRSSTRPSPATAAKGGGMSALTAESLLSSYAALLRGPSVTTGGEDRTAKEAEVERLFARMTHKDMVHFCCEVHRLLLLFSSSYNNNNNNDNTVSVVRSGTPPRTDFSAVVADEIRAPFSNNNNNNNNNDDNNNNMHWDQSVANQNEQKHTSKQNKLVHVAFIQENQLDEKNNNTTENEQNVASSPSRLDHVPTPPSASSCKFTTRRVSKTDWIDGTKILNEYMILKNIGRGASGKVKLAYGLSRNETVAIKIIPRPKEKKNHFGVGGDSSSKRLKALKREIEVMKKLRHKNIVTLHEVIDDPDAEKLYLVMQYVDNGPLTTVDKNGRCSKMEPDEVAMYARQILAGLEYLHNCDVVHRDIKPENILVDTKQHVFLADFGVSAILEEDNDDLFKRFEGTPLFMPPEVFSNKNSKGNNNNNDDNNGSHDNTSLGNPFAMDVWSLGVTFYTLVMGQVPFFSVSEIEAVLDSPVVITDEIPKAWKSLLESMLSGDPRRRPDIGSVRKQVNNMSCRKRTSRPKLISETCAQCGNDDYNDNNNNNNNNGDDDDDVVDDDDVLSMIGNALVDPNATSPHGPPPLQAPWLILPRLSLRQPAQALAAGSKTDTPESSTTVLGMSAGESNVNSALLSVTRDQMTRRIRETVSLNTLAQKNMHNMKRGVQMSESHGGKVGLFMEAVQRPLKK